MKTIQTQLKRAFSICIALQIAAIAFMTIPQFEGIRTTLAGSLNLSSSLLWLPIGLLLVIGFIIALKALNLVVAKPIETLARHARDGDSAGFVFQKKSSLDEEAILKRFFEEQTQKTLDAEGQFDGLKQSLAQANDQIGTLASLSERQARELAQFEQSQRELRVSNQSLSAENEVLSTTLESERKTKVGREVKMRAQEIYAQMERAVAQSSARSIWIPNLIEQLKTPTVLINDLSRRLESSWQQTSLERLGEEIAEIRHQSDLQRTLLGELSPEQLLAAVPEASPVLEAESDLKPEATVAAPIETIEAETTSAANSDPQETCDQPETSANEEPAKSIQLDSTETQAKAPSLSLQIEDEPIPNSEPIEIASEALPAPVENDASESQEEAETLTALQTLVFELVQEYSQEVENVTIDTDFQEKVDMEVDEELLESVLSNLIEIAIYQWKEGSVKLHVSRDDNQITFAVDSKGKPLQYGEFDETQTNRIESALDRKIDVDMPSENELRMRYKYIPEEN